jgi:hypothetical protein
MDLERIIERRLAAALVSRERFADGQSCLNLAATRPLAETAWLPTDQRGKKAHAASALQGWLPI